MAEACFENDGNSISSWKGIKVLDGLRKRYSRKKANLRLGWPFNYKITRIAPDIQIYYFRTIARLPLRKFLCDDFIVDDVDSNAVSKSTPGVQSKLSAAQGSGAILGARGVRISCSLS